MGQRLSGRRSKAPSASICPPARVTYADVLTNNTICCLSAMIDTEKVGKVCMPEGKYARDDMVTWLRVLKKCGECLNTPENPGECLSVPEKRGECLSVGVVLAKYRTGAASVFLIRKNS